LIYGEPPEKDSDQANKFGGLWLISLWFEGRDNPGDKGEKSFRFLLDMGAHEGNEVSAAWDAGL
jgi:hypothetical protein